LNADQPIGIFDSGLGGLTVAAAIARALPKEELLYLGDTARVPYGTRSPATVVRYARKNVAFLKNFQVKLVVVACNTVSAQGLGGLADGSKIPLMGVIRPGARAAQVQTQSGEIAILGTPATIYSGAYEHALHELDHHLKLLSIPCPLFVPLVESGWLEHSVTRMVVQDYLAPLKGSEVDTIILGCTHYPLLAPLIAEEAEQLLGYAPQIIDSAQAVAVAVQGFLGAEGLRENAAGRGRFFVTDTPQGAAQVAGRFWGAALGETLQLEHIDLLDDL